MTKAQGRRHNKNQGRYKDQAFKTERNKKRREAKRNRLANSIEHRKAHERRALARIQKNHDKGIPRKRQGPNIMSHLKPGKRVKVTVNGSPLEGLLAQFE